VAAHARRADRCLFTPGQQVSDVFYVRSAAGLPLGQRSGLAVLSTTRAPCLSKLCSKRVSTLASGASQAVYPHSVGAPLGTLWLHASGM